MKRIEFIKLASLSGLALLAAPSCTDLELETSKDTASGTDAMTSNDGSSQFVSPFRSNIGNRIPVGDARSWTTEYANANTGENHFQISRADLEELLKSDDCDGVIFQLGSSDEDRMRLILAEVNKAGKANPGTQYGIAGTRLTGAFD